jgi:hypothetical protein
MNPTLRKALPQPGDADHASVHGFVHEAWTTARKRHVAVDAIGLLLTVLVTAAGVQVLTITKFPSQGPATIR